MIEIIKIDLEIGTEREVQLITTVISLNQYMCVEMMQRDAHFWRIVVYI